MNKNWSRFVKFITTIMSVILTVFPFLSKASPENKVNITINPCSQQQEWNGFGTSTCWWSQNISDEETRKDLAKELFSSDGLGLNILRYNVGGGVNPEHNRVSNSWRTTESFYYFNEESGKWEYDFTRDANAQAFLDEALKQKNSTVNTVVLFANSPHYSMTISGEASGNTEQGKTNITREHYQDFVDYFLTITEYFIEKGVPVKYISPINEPQWDWSGDWVGQEGCHYEPEQVYELLALFSKGIDERGLDVKISCPESGEIGETTTNYFKTITADKETYKNVTSLAYHSYWSDNFLNAKQDVGELIEDGAYDGYTVDMTEWCELPCTHSVDDVNGAVMMARIMANDINYSEVNSWSSWVAVNQIGIGEDGKIYSDGLFYAKDDFSSYSKAARYYAVAHFSKFVPAGSVVLETSSDKASAAYNYHYEDWNKQYLECNYCAFKTPEGKTVLVVTNEGHDRTVVVPTLSCKMSVYTTDSEHTLEETYNGINTGRVTVSTNSITTIVFE